MSSFFPTQTLPSFTSIPASSTTSISTSSSSVTVEPNTKRMIAEAVGITLGLGLGLTAVAVAVFYHWKRRKQRLEDVGIDEAKSEWSKSTDNFRLSHLVPTKRDVHSP